MGAGSQASGGCLRMGKALGRRTWNYCVGLVLMQHVVGAAWKGDWGQGWHDISLGLHDCHQQYVRGEGCMGDLGFGETGLTGRVVSELTDEMWTSVMVAIAMTMSSRRGIWCRMFCGSEGGRCGWRVGRDGGVCVQEGRALGEDYR